MTGFARVRKTVAEGEIVVALKSVNHRGLDLHFHLSPELDPLETELRAAVKSGVARGHVQINITLMRPPGNEKAPVNWAVVDAYVAAFREASDRYGLEG